MRARYPSWARGLSFPVDSIAVPTAYTPRYLAASEESERREAKKAVNSKAARSRQHSLAPNHPFRTHLPVSLTPRGRPRVFIHPLESRGRVWESPDERRQLV